MTGVLIPGAEKILYGEFDHGEVVKFGYLDQEPVYNEDVRFDWGAWVDKELAYYGYEPWSWSEMTTPKSCGEMV
jgi:hypothetical protein